MERVVKVTMSTKRSLSLVILSTKLLFPAPLGAATIIIRVFIVVAFSSLLHVLNLFSESLNKGFCFYHGLSDLGYLRLRPNRIHLAEQLLGIEIQFFAFSRLISDEMTIVFDMFTQTRKLFVDIGFFKLNHDFLRQTTWISFIPLQSIAY